MPVWLAKEQKTTADRIRCGMQLKTFVKGPALVVRHDCAKVTFVSVNFSLRCFMKSVVLLL